MDSSVSPKDENLISARVPSHFNWPLIVLLLSRECVVFLSFKHRQCIRFVGKTGTVTCRTKACHGAGWPTLVLNYDVDRTKVTPVLHMQEVAGPGLV